MHTPETLAAKSDDEMRETLAELASEFYGHDRWKTQLGRDTGYSGEAVKNWHRTGSRPPALVLMWLETQLSHRQAVGILQQMNAAHAAARAFGTPEG